MVVVADQRPGLELVDQLVGPVEVPVGVGPVPPAVEPDAADLAVVGAELADLALVIGDVRLPVAPVLAAGGLARLAPREVVGMMPVEQRVIEEELDALLVAGVGQRLQRVLAIRGGVDDVVVRSACCRTCRSRRGACS